jgi:adenosine kinase
VTYKVAAIGPIPRDEITTHTGEELRRYGCVLYTTAVLSALIGESGRVVPVSHVRQTDADPVRALLGSLPGVALTHVSDESDTGDVINLMYVDQNRRIERQTGFMNPSLPADMSDLHDCDAFVFVPVTDFEVSLDLLRSLKSDSSGLVILDAHGPTNTATRHGERHLKYWVDRDQWLPFIDVLKMNLEEAACAWFSPEYTPAELERRSDGYQLPLDELPRFAEHCLDHGVSALYVTLDEHGCVVYFRDESGTREEFVKRIRVDQVIDTTGCGDSFAGGLAFGLLHTGDYVEACKYGNAAGAQRCASTEQTAYLPLAETEQQILDAYGPSKGRS